MPRKKPDQSESTGSIQKSLSVRCRFCGQKNNVKADYKNRDANCGKCKLPLSNEPRKGFADLHKNDYIHPADAAAMKALKAIPGVDSALKKLLAWTGESAIRVAFMASAVKVTPKQCPDLYTKLEIACSTLGVEMPDLYVQQNPIVNAFTGGVEKPIIVLHSALVERLSDEETLAVIAHEVGHIHSEHVLYITAAPEPRAASGGWVDEPVLELQLQREVRLRERLQQQPPVVAPAVSELPPPAATQAATSAPSSAPRPEVEQPEASSAGKENKPRPKSSATPRPEDVLSER